MSLSTVLMDAGPLIAIVDRNQKGHLQCVEICQSINVPLITTISCFTEAMYTVSKVRGWTGQQVLWQLWERDAFLIHSSSKNEHKRMRVLMEKYKDTPMDFADASLVAAAESLGLSRIFTLDSDFYVYRINDKDAFEVVP